MRIIFAALFLILLGPGFARTQETVIKGDTMEIIDKGEAILFRGNVELEHSSDTIKAQRMETTKSREKVKASGKVQLFRKLDRGGSIRASGERGVYNTQTGDGFLTGNGKSSHVVYKDVLSSTITRTVDVYASRFDFSEGNSTGTAVGKVYGKSIDQEKGDFYEFWSDKADFNHEMNRITLSGPTQPRVSQTTQDGNRVIQGDLILYDTDKRKFNSLGRSHAVFMQRRKKGNQP